jgi:NADPH:quinone reductase-like Zn-dependent oxidoreductase
VTSLAVLPEHLDAVTAAALPLAGLTATRLLRAAGSVIGRRLLITGASGGVGHYVVELAANSGAEVTAVSASTSRGARLAELGANVVTSVDDAEGTFDVVMESPGGT